MPIPTLVVVSGPPSSGKTTLAHVLARAIPCPAICRDEIKEGMVHAQGADFQAAAGDPLTVRTLSVFFDTVRLLLTARVTVVAEAAFQDLLWRPGLEPLAGLAQLRIVQCKVEPAVAHERYVRRNAVSADARRAHAVIIGTELEDWERAYSGFDRVSMPAPSLDVDTTDGYAPDVAEIVEFVNRTEVSVPPHESDAAEQSGQILEVVLEVLGPDVVGAYLHGSATLGGLRLRSDIDVLVVSRRRTTREEKWRLVDRLLAISGSESPGPPRPIELTIVVESEIRPWRYPPRMDFQYGEWLRSEFESGNVEPWPTTTNPDLGTLITMVLLGDRPLLGPPPAEVFDPVPRADYARAILDGIDGLLDDLNRDTRNLILTLARIWSTLATDVIRSKDDAADWALARLPDEHRPVLARARAIYLGDEEERWDDLRPRVLPHAEYVVGEIRRLATDGVAQPGPVRQAPADDS